MKNLGIIVVCLLHLIGAMDTALAQSDRHSLNVYTGFGVGTPDKRYEFLQNQYVSSIVNAVISEIKNTTNDNEYYLGIAYHHKPVNRLNLGIGLGYAQLKQDFLLPANGNSYFGAVVEPFFWRHYSRYHMLQLSPEIRLDLIKYRSMAVGINTRLISNISFRKEINYIGRGPLSLNKYQTEFFATEFYPGVHLRLDKFCIELTKRVHHWKYRDDAIANNELSVDTYNPSKWRFAVSYEFWNSKKK